MERAHAGVGCRGPNRVPDRAARNPELRHRHRCGGRPGQCGHPTAARLQLTREHSCNELARPCAAVGAERRALNTGNIISSMRPLLPALIAFAALTGCALFRAPPAPPAPENPGAASAGSPGTAHPGPQTPTQVTPAPPSPAAPTVPPKQFHLGAAA